MLVNNNLTESNLEALRTAILTETSVLGTALGEFNYNCTAKITEGNLLYRIKFELLGEEDQTLVVLSAKPASYILAMLVAPIIRLDQHKILHKRFPYEGEHVSQAFEDFKKHQSVAVLTRLETKQEVIDYDYIRGKVQNIYVAQHANRDHLSALIKGLLHKQNGNLYATSILAVITFILAVVVLWRL